MKDPRFWMNQFYGYLPELMRTTVMGNPLKTQVPDEHRPLLRSLFEAVHGNLTLPEFYKTQVYPNETNAVLVEGYRAWWQIDMMVENYESTKNEEKTLQIRLESIKDDFEGNMRCILGFLKESYPFNVDLALEKLAPLADHDAGVTEETDNGEFFEALKTLPWLEGATQRLSAPALRSC